MTDLIEDSKRYVIVTSDGRPFYLNDPQPEDIHIEHIAHALSNQGRWTGHTQEFYSVAQHCLDVSLLVPQEYALTALLHDASEAYIGDISTPLKWMLEAKAPGLIKGIEDKIHQAIADKFGTIYPYPPEVKHADMVAAATERRDLLVDWDQHGIDWIDGWPEPDPRPLIPLPPAIARAGFLQRFRDLTKPEAGWGMVGNARLDQ